MSNEERVLNYEMWREKKIIQKKKMMVLHNYLHSN